MKLSQDRLLAFYEITKVGSFTQAAKSIGISQSALSHRIKNLESDLKVSLFIREPSGLHLTEAGTRLFNYCQVQLKIEDEFIHDLLEKNTRDLRGALRIASVSSLAWSVIVPVLGDLIRKNPLLHLDILAREVSELPLLLKHNRMDYIVTLEKINDSSLEETIIGTEKYVLIEAKQKSLRNDIYLDHDERDRFTFDFLSLQGKQNEKIKRSFLDDNYGLIEGVKEGFGRAVIPKHLAEQTSEIKILRNLKTLEKPIYFYFAKQPFYTKLHSQVVEVLSKNVFEKLK